jgi:FtsH-binding integral membrane protein
MGLKAFRRRGGLLLSSAMFLVLLSVAATNHSWVGLVAAWGAVVAFFAPFMIGAFAPVSRPEAIPARRVTQSLVGSTLASLVLAVIAYVQGVYEGMAAFGGAAILFAWMAIANNRQAKSR